MSFTDTNISDFIAGMLTLGGGNLITSDDSKIITNVDGEPRTLTLEDGTERKLAIFGTKATDVIIINPFAEGETNSARNNWFYHSRNILMSMMITKCMKSVLDVSARAHSKKTKEEKDDKKFIPYLGKYAQACDAKTVDEFMKLVKIPTDFFCIYYNKHKKRAEVKSNLFREETKTIYSNIRNASWDALKGVFLKVLGVKDLEELNTPSTSQNVPVLESFTNVYLKIFDKMKNILELNGIQNINTEDLWSHVKMLDAYHQRAKWCMTTLSIAAAEKQKDASAKEAKRNAIPTTLTGATPWNTSAVPQAWAQPNANPFVNTMQPVGYQAPQQFGMPYGMQPAAPAYQAPVGAAQVPWTVPAQPAVVPVAAAPVAMAPVVAPVMAPVMAPVPQVGMMPTTMMGQGTPVSAAQPASTPYNNMLSQGVPRR